MGTPIKTLGCGSTSTPLRAVQMKVPPVTANVSFEGVRKDSAGYKMLASMGWREGDGLGVDGSGIQRHIQVKKLKERQGIGVDQMSEKVRKEWEQNSVRYEEVLQQLTEIRSETTSDRGMKKRRTKERKKTKLRHSGRYSRHERAKMVKSYSEADLAAVLGTTPGSMMTQPSGADLSDPAEMVEEDGERSLTKAPQTLSSQEDDKEKSSLKSPESQIDGGGGWWSKRFVHAGMLKSLKPTAPGRLPHHQSTVTVRHFSAEDQTELYTQVRKSASKARRGLGKGKEDSRIGGAKINQGKRNTFDEEEESQPAPESLQAAIPLKKKIKSKRKKQKTDAGAMCY